MDTYSMILLNGAIPLPLAIMMSGFYGAANVDSNEFILNCFGWDLRKVLVNPLAIVETQRSTYSSLFLHDARV